MRILLLALLVYFVYHTHFDNPESSSSVDANSGSTIMNYKYKDGIYTLNEAFKKNQQRSYQMDDLETSPDITFSDFKKIKKIKSNGAVSLSVKLTPEAAEILKGITEDNVGMPLPVVFHDEIIFAPKIMMAITEGAFSITGVSEKVIDAILEEYK